MQVSGPSSSSSRSSFSTALPALAIEAAQEGSWKAYLDDEKTGLIFYYNHQTGESKWEPPSPSFPAAAERRGVFYLFYAVIISTCALRALFSFAQLAQ
jgi:hypothetical protein